MTYTKPDWVVIGGQYEDKVILWASKSLLRAELETLCINPDDICWRGLPPLYKVNLHVSMKEDYVMICAPDYPTAWQSLFKIWSPNGEVPNEQIEQKRALEIKCRT